MRKKHGWLSNLIGCAAAAVILFFVYDGRGLVNDVVCLAELGRAEQAECISADRYVHGTLDAEYQTVYDQMLDAILNMKERVRLSTTDADAVQTCYNAICADYGEIFWMDSCSYRVVTLLGNPFAVSFEAEYSYTPEEVAAYQQEMQPQIDRYLEELSACETDYDKTRLVYERLIQDVSYDLSAANNQNILSVFLGKKTVCQGYACAAQYLLQQSGVECAVVIGNARREPHAWNLVRLDDDYYYMDVTWGNAEVSEEDETQSSAYDYSGINYGYLNITTEELLRHHEPVVDFPLPECTADQDNYFVKNDCRFASWDAAAVGERLRSACADGETELSLKFGDAAALRKAQNYLIYEQHFADYCAGISQIYYLVDRDLNILTICFDAGKL